MNNKLRYLDIDDLYALRFLGSGCNVTDTAKYMTLSTPAITQRVHKIEKALGFTLQDRTAFGTKLTGKGMILAGVAGVVLGVLEAFIDKEEITRSQEPELSIPPVRNPLPPLPRKVKAPRGPTHEKVPRSIDTREANR